MLTDKQLDSRLVFTDDQVRDIVIEACSYNHQIETWFREHDNTVTFRQLLEYFNNDKARTGEPPGGNRSYGYLCYLLVKHGCRNGHGFDSRILTCLYNTRTNQTMIERFYELVEEEGPGFIQPPLVEEEELISFKLYYTLEEVKKIVRSQCKLKEYIQGKMTKHKEVWDGVEYYVVHSQDILDAIYAVRSRIIGGNVYYVLYWMIDEFFEGDEMADYLRGRSEIMHLWCYKDKQKQYLIKMINLMYRDLESKMEEESIPVHAEEMEDEIQDWCMLNEEAYDIFHSFKKDDNVAYIPSSFFNTIIDRFEEVGMSDFYSVFKSVVVCHLIHRGANSYNVWGYTSMIGCYYDKNRDNKDKTWTQKVFECTNEMIKFHGKDFGVTNE